MFLTCPHCTTVFRVNTDLIPEDGRTVRCSICHHIWIASLVPPSASQPVVQSVDGAVVAGPVSEEFVLPRCDGIVVILHRPEPGA